MTIIEEDRAIEASKDKFKAKLYGRMHVLHSDLGLVEDFEDWRQNLKNKMLIYFDDIYELLKTKN